MLTKILPYTIKEHIKKSVSASEGSHVANKEAYILHNAGDSTIYIKNETGVTTDDWELAPGEKSVVLNSDIYFVSAAATTLKILVLEDA